MAELEGGQIKGQLSLFDMRPACKRIGGCLAEIGARLSNPAPELWDCSCGRSAPEIKAASDD
jgi:hypothetical protein